jgi:hypothetical protein
LSEDNSLSENERSRYIRLNGFEGILREQFQLSYFGKIDYGASEGMTYQERRTMYKILIEQKQEERKQHEEAVKAARARQSSNRGRR